MQNEIYNFSTKAREVSWRQHHHHKERAPRISPVQKDLTIFHANKQVGKQTQNKTNGDSLKEKQKIRKLGFGCFYTHSCLMSYLRNWPTQVSLAKVPRFYFEELLFELRHS